MRSETLFRAIIGLGAVSTAYYVRRIHEKFKVGKQDFSTCPFILYQVDFQEINPFLPNDFDRLIPILKRQLCAINKMGVSKLLIPNITLHETLDRVQTHLHVCHAVHLTVNFLMEKGISGITLFGTSYTMNSGPLHQKFNKSNIQIFLPSEEDQLWLDGYRKNVFSGHTNASDTDHYQNLIRKYGKENAVVIGCTELSIYSLKGKNFCIDMAELQIDDFLKE